VSDEAGTHVWLAHHTVERAQQDVTDLRTRLDRLVHKVSTRVHDFRGEEFRAVRDLLVDIVGDLRQLDPAELALLLSSVEQAGTAEPLPYRVPAGMPRGPVGEDTGAWRAGGVYMPRNRGPQL
jgi:hypothetical protein